MSLSKESVVFVVLANLVLTLVVGALLALVRSRCPSNQVTYPMLSVSRLRLIVY